MSCSNARLIVGAILIALAACADEGPTAVTAAAPPVADLAVAAPSLTPADLFRVSATTVGDPADAGPRLSEDKGDDEGSAEIRMARTVVGFFPGEAYAQGSMRYTGQGGRVETTVQVAFMDQHMGSATAIEQRTDWLSFDVEKFMFAYASIRTDKTCGLSVMGDSVHSAWWEIFQVRSAPVFGKAVATSRAGPERQTTCQRKTSTTDPTGTYDSTPGLVCTYLITYDRDTHEILAVELLRCDASHGPLI